MTTSFKNKTMLYERIACVCVVFCVMLPREGATFIRTRLLGWEASSGKSPSGIIDGGSLRRAAPNTGS